MTFTPIEKQKLNPDEPAHAVASYVESTGDEDEYLYLTNDETGEDAGSFIVLSPREADNLSHIIQRWLENVRLRI